MYSGLFFVVAGTSLVLLSFSTRVFWWSKIASAEYKNDMLMANPG